MLGFASWYSFSESPCGKTSDVTEEEDPNQLITNSDPATSNPQDNMANPQDQSFEKDCSSGDEDFHNVNPLKKMMTTSNDYQYRSPTTSPPSKNTSATNKDPGCGGSGNTNPNQASSGSPARSFDSPEKPTTPTSQSPFHDMWQRFSDPLTPSLQTLEEGKQLIQRHFTYFFEGEACSQNARVEVNQMIQKQNGQESDSTQALPATGAENTNPQQQSPSGASQNKAAVATTSRWGGYPLPATDPRKREKGADKEVKTVEISANEGANSSDKAKKKAPVEHLEVRTEDAYELERSISELTMRSSYGGGESLSNVPDNRRMAYYAVGKNHRNSGKGGNRRCYFSGKLILGGAPFYAGAVQQGLRTLVVFCLPSALNLPDREKLQKLSKSAGVTRRLSKTPSASSLGGSSGNILRPGKTERSIAGKSLTSQSKRSVRRGVGSHRQNNSMSNDDTSRITSLDDLSLSIDGDLDPNWGLDRDLLLQVLPEADESLLESMGTLFPEQFETLPVQVRDATKWHLYVKFCFFSGLPIAEGEMHYKVQDELAEQVYGEEIVLSHDVMEAVNGDISADILQLPNLKVFRYLRKHYAQQCSKLDDSIFRRSAWSRVAPEV